MGNGDFYVIKEGLRKTNGIITDILQQNLTTEGRILEKLEELSETIKINYQKMNNKSLEVDHNMNTFKKNCNGAMTTFEQTITMYETAHVEGAKLFKRAGDVNEK